MRVVFLDIDGVLNHPGCYGAEAAARELDDGGLVVPIAAECIKRLNRIVAENDAKVVMSTSWRLFTRWQDLGPALARYGMVADVIGETPDLINDAEWLDRWRTREGAPFMYERLERGMEIREWLGAHPEVTSFIILDDSNDMADLKPWFVLTDPVTGLDECDVERARWLFANPPEGNPRALAIGSSPDIQRRWR